MTDIAPINMTPRSRTVEAARASSISKPQRLSAPARESVRTDQAELSDRARLLSKLRDLPAVRADLVTRIKTQIQTGEYETPDKLNDAISALTREIEDDA